MLTVLPSSSNFLGFYVFRKDFTLIFLPFPRVFGVSLFSAKALHHGDTVLQLDWLLALVSTIALHGKTRL